MTSTYEGLLGQDWQIQYINQVPSAIVCPLCGALVALGRARNQNRDIKSCHVQWHAMLDSQLYLYNIPTPTED